MEPATLERIVEPLRRTTASGETLRRPPEIEAEIAAALDLGRREIETSRERCGGDLEAMVDALEVSKEGLRRRLKQLGLR